MLRLPTLLEAIHLPVPVVVPMRHAIKIRHLRVDGDDNKKVNITQNNKIAMTYEQGFHSKFHSWRVFL